MLLGIEHVLGDGDPLGRGLNAMLAKELRNVLPHNVKVS
jgi:hypothetical protein